MSYRALKIISNIKAIPLIQTFLAARPVRLAYSIPPANIYTLEDAYVIDLALPGLNKEDILLKTCDHTLALTVNKRNGDSAALKWIAHEFNFNCFSRSFLIPREYNISNTHVSYEKGILKITFYKLK